MFNLDLRINISIGLIFFITTTIILLRNNYLSFFVKIYKTYTEYIAFEVFLFVYRYIFEDNESFNTNINAMLLRIAGVNIILLIGANINEYYPFLT